VPVLFDSGIRCGADAFKALALGATAILIGRTYAFGLALAGAAGVREVIANLVAELDVTMALAGVASIDELDRNALVPA
jgi:lactate 2-monooxygenase